MSLDTAVTTSLVSEIMSKLGSVIMKGKQVPQLVRIITEPPKFRFTKLKRASTTSTTFPDLDSPDIEIKNPLDRDTTIKHLTIIPDGTFKTNGSVKIFVDDVKAFENDAAADFTDIAELKIEAITGKAIKQKRSIKVLMKTSAGTSKLALAVTFGD